MNPSLARLDLNLLLTLQLLIQEKSVTKVAKRLSVTPSTVSKALAKLRNAFGDPLFIKTPQGLASTPLVDSLALDLADWTQIGNQIVEKAQTQAARGVEFHLALESPLLLTFLDDLMVKIHQDYPEAKIRTSHWDYDSIEGIVNGAIDIGFTGRETHPRSKESLDLLPYFIDHEILFSDLPKVFVRNGHPILEQEWTLDNFLAYRHIGIVWEKNETWALDEVLHDMGRERQVGLTMSSFEQSLFMAAQPNHDMFTTAPGYCQQYVESLNLDLVCLPIPLAKEELEKLEIPFTMIWHKRNAYNPKTQWLKEAFRSIVASMH
ncbi:HTH-type transcriptional regulator YidZ [Vibrio astriarenae]|uniref:HTH-type transcriptional regulator YidZ n=1 Tax=Vibrio astriarenae TaxID=1481923 RepID=A0A7Z2YDT7_9VIBR|nr:HTH-type transcriptional regulator YidZ [Vibrio astriarenae]QIA63514.1 HTH-type transcriptional regulator YidZ [Vibrio astriarenae]